LERRLFMLPVGPLMVEHRLIEKMVPLILREVAEAGRSGKINLQFVDKAVDFIRTYADKCHHGKEEDILFRELGKKMLLPEHARIMAELVEEHRQARKIVGELMEAAGESKGGGVSALAVVIERFKEIAGFYPRHIEKEDKHFFLPCMDYFSSAEKESLLREESEFDRNFIHRLYKDRLSAAERLIKVG
jgi:hemerythrin-like domain-containing protein